MTGPLEEQPNNAEQAAVERFQQRLVAALYRFDCPEPDALLDYVNLRLDGKVHAQVQAHLAICTSCQMEVVMLRGTAATDAQSIPPKPDWVAEGQQLLRALLIPNVRLVLRGDSADAENQLVYAIEPVGWELHLSRDTDTQGFVLSGQLIGPDIAELETMKARLSSADDLTAESVLDDTGYFVFRLARPGLFDLRIESERVRFDISGIQLG